MRYLTLLLLLISSDAFSSIQIEPRHLFISQFPAPPVESRDLDFFRISIRRWKHQNPSQIPILKTMMDLWTQGPNDSLKLDLVCFSEDPIDFEQAEWLKEELSLVLKINPKKIGVHQINTIPFYEKAGRCTLRFSPERKLKRIIQKGEILSWQINPQMIFKP